MAIVLTDSTNYENIANAIRTQNGTDETYYPNEMAAAISALSTGVDISTFDTTPAQDSANGVTSGGVYTAIENVKSSIPTSTSQLINDSGYLTSYIETDPTVPDWAKQSVKPTYTASEVGAATEEHTHKMSDINGLEDALTDTSPSIHASQHAFNGSDPITPQMIGAQAALSGIAGQIVGFDSNGNVTAQDFTADTLISHASIHASGGRDPITPASIGAATSDHNHDGVYAPAYTYSTTDLTAGTSTLETGKLYFVYE